MHTRLLVPALFVSLLCTAGAGEAAVRVDCRPANGGPCVAPPAPPAAPLPGGMTAAIAPLPPVPPAPALPALPAPPAPPALPEIPAKAHAACAGKANGSQVTVQLEPGETMSGLCERVGGKTVFRLRSYRHG